MKAEDERDFEDVKENLTLLKEIKTELPKGFDDKKAEAVAIDNVYTFTPTGELTIRTEGYLEADPEKKFKEEILINEKVKTSEKK